MGNPYPARFTEKGGSVRLQGELDFTDPANQPGGSSLAVGALLGLPNIDIHAAASYPLKWDSLHDDPFAFNPLAAIPAGLGLTFAFDGSDATITTTEAGVWAFTLAFQVPPDATWFGTLQMDLNLVATATGVVSPNIGNQFTLVEVVKYPSGASIVPAITTNALGTGTANPLNASGFMEIVRLA